MELKLEHLAPYLPFQLKAIDDFGKQRIIEWECQTYTNTIVGLNHVINSESVQVNCFKPILRPLSDIIEYCINGKCLLDLIRDRYNEENEEPITSVEFHNVGGLTLFGLMNENIEVAMPYWAYQCLFQWQFDVFGLIESGSAININELNNNHGQ